MTNPLTRRLKDANDSKLKVDKSGGDGSALTVVAQGGTVARTNASRAADTINILSFRNPSDIDDTNALASALAFAAAAPYGAIIEFPSGRQQYKISSALAVTLTGFSGIKLKGAGANFTELVWTSDTDGINITLASNATWLRQGGNTGPVVSVEGISFVRGVSGTARAALSVTASGTIGIAGLRQVQTQDVIFRGDATAGGWAKGEVLTGVSHADIRDVYYHAASGGSTTGDALSISGLSNAISVDHYVENLRQFGGGTAIVLGDYLQGVYLHRVTATGSQNGIVGAGVNFTLDNITITLGQFNTYVTGVDFLKSTSVLVSNSYFLSYFNTPAENWVALRLAGGSERFTITGNSFYGWSKTTQSAIVIADSPKGGTISANHFYLWQTAVRLTGTTGYTNIVANTFHTTSVMGTDSNARATGNFWSFNILGGVLINSDTTTTGIFNVSNGISITGNSGEFNVVGSKGIMARFVPPTTGNVVNRPIFTPSGVTGGTVTLSTAGTDANVPFAVLGAGNAGLLGGAFVRTVDPTTTDIPAGQFALWNNTTAGTFKLIANISGTLRSVALN